MDTTKSTSPTNTRNSNSTNTTTNSTNINTTNTNNKNDTQAFSKLINGTKSVFYSLQSFTLKKDKDEDESYFAPLSKPRSKKILLLGTGHSGKSTIFKQVQLISGYNASVEENKHFVSVARDNVIFGNSCLAEYVSTSTFQVSPQNSNIANKLLDPQEITPHFSQYAQSIHSMWMDPAIQHAFANYHDITHFPYVTLQHFMDKIDEMVQDTYVPTTEDVLRVRVRTTGLVELFVSNHDQAFTFIDTGGERSERRKWIHCFDDTKAIIFCVSLDEYDRVLAEDASTNRMQESLRLFEEIVNSRWFRANPIFLFFTKDDLFREHITKVSLKRCFNDFEGPEGQYEPAFNFIKNKFLGTNLSQKEIGVHVTCALDTNNVRNHLDAVFNAVRSL